VLGALDRELHGRRLPHVKIAGRIKFKASEVEPWLEENRHMERIA
jgi:hypothetical protein